MKVIILNGLIASGKTTLGKLLADHFHNHDERAIFYDLDDLVEKRNSNFKWESKDAQTRDWLKARKELADLTNESVKQGNNVVVVGPFFQRDEISGFVKYLNPTSEVYLYTLIIPLDERLRRNSLRKWSNPEEDLKVQQNTYEKLTERFGHDIENIGVEEESLERIINAVNQSLGRIDIADFI